MNAKKSLTPIQRIAALRKSGVTLFPHLSKVKKQALLFIEDEPVISAKKTNAN